jgi:hypothetical protein
VSDDAVDTPPGKRLEGWAKLVRDWKRLSKFAVKLGIVLAIVCHALPPRYRAPCDHLKALCRPFGD